MFKNYGLYDGNFLVYEYGRHTYWTNIPFNPKGIEQTRDFASVNKPIMVDGKKMWLTPKGKIVNSNGVTRLKSNTQGGDNVHKVIEYWLEVVTNGNNSNNFRT